MSRFVYLILFLTFLMTGHIIAYNEVDDYRFLWKKIKNPEASVYPEKTEITDDTSVLAKPKPSNDLVIYEDVTNIKAEVIETTSKEDANEETKPLVEEPKEEVIETIIEEPEEETQTFLLNSQNEIFLSKFEWDFREKTKIEDIMSSNIDYYETFLKRSFDKYDVYVFGEGKYEDIFSFFDVRADETGLTSNVVNNFWDRSFYLNEESKNTVRIVLETEYNTYWFVVPSENYNYLKEILKEL